MGLLACSHLTVVPSTLPFFALGPDPDADQAGDRTAVNPQPLFVERLSLAPERHQIQFRTAPALRTAIVSLQEPSSEQAPAEGCQTGPRPHRNGEWTSLHNTASIELILQLITEVGLCYQS